jgi:hypothetical protein
MSEERTFAVTLVRVGPGLPYFEVAAYRYTAEWLPAVGDIITVTNAVAEDGEQGEQILAYVTQVSPSSETPIRVTHAKGVSVSSRDDYIVAA